MKKFLLVLVAGVVITFGGNVFLDQFAVEAEHPDPTSIHFAVEAEHPDPTSFSDLV